MTAAPHPSEGSLLQSPHHDLTLSISLAFSRAPESTQQPRGQNVAEVTGSLSFSYL